MNRYFAWVCACVFSMDVSVFNKCGWWVGVNERVHVCHVPT